MLPHSKILPLTLAVSSCFMTSAFAASGSTLTITNTEDTPYTADIKVSSESENANLTNSGFIVNNSIVVADYGTFNNTGTIKTGVLDIAVAQANNIGGTIEATEKFTYRGAAGNNFRQALSATVVTPLLEIIGKTNSQTGLDIQSQAVLDGIDAIRVEGNGQRTMLAFKDGETFSYDGTVTLRHNVEGDSTRLEVGQSGAAQVTLAEVISEKGKTNIQVNESSSVTVKKITVQDQGKLELGSWGKEEQNTASMTLSELHLGKEAKVTGIVYGETVQSMSITGDIALTMDEGASADFTQTNQQAEVKFGASSLAVTVLDAHSGNQILLSEANSTLDPTKVSVTGAASSNTGNAKRT